MTRLFSFVFRPDQLLPISNAPLVPREELLGTYWKGEQSPSKEATHQSIGYAVVGNHIDTVEYLGEYGFEAYLRYRNHRGENVLHLAAKLCNPDMFRILIPRFPEGVYAEDDIGETPLLRVIMSPSTTRYECAIILLLANANREIQCLYYQEQALRTAVLRRDLHMCCVLISIGNLSPLRALASDGEDQTNSKERGLGNLGNEGFRFCLFFVREKYIFYINIS
jgi:hypothetical protein